jgi:hypothetical protein
MSMTDNSQSPLPPNAQITADELRLIQEHRARQAATQPQSPVVMHNPQIQFTLSAEDLARVVDGVVFQVAHLLESHLDAIMTAFNKVAIKTTGQPLDK